MDLKDLDAWFRSNLDLEGFARIDDSLNGVQVGRRGGPIGHAAFAVDACAETIRRAAASGAQLLFVHHGFFWGKNLRLEGALLERIRLLLEADLALYACHLPLDAHPKLGNNAALARMLGLSALEGFGEHHGVKLGFAGTLEPPIDFAEAVKRILPDRSAPRAAIPGRSAAIRRAAVVSGGAPFEALEAIESGMDLYVTGEPSHSVYHAVVESGIGFIAAGHYATEVWGVRAVAEALARETGIRTSFIDLPTGL
ncbi:MAG TPA: Nif3-like dinuclear metal center hexameric protein [Rectinemataceae bacterium]|nr:Nif3-like dinuclear metal center hexameric protein [Rectinemataceae bacterium]